MGSSMTLNKASSILTFKHREPLLKKFPHRPGSQNDVTLEVDAKNLSKYDLRVDGFRIGSIDK
jgi:hypothetical protein